MAYAYFNNLPRITGSHKVLFDTAFNVAKTSKYDDYQGGLVSMVYKFFEKKSAARANKFAGDTVKRACSKMLDTQDKSGIKNNIMSSQQLAKELHKPIIRKIEKWKAHSFFIDNIWGADLANVQLINKFNKEIRFLLCVIDIFSKYAWIFLLKNEKRYYNCQYFSKILNESGRKPKRLWLDKGSDFYDRLMKLLLQDNDM